MAYDKYFKNELDNHETQYFILDTKGEGNQGDVDFIKYQWSRSKYNLVKEGDLFLYRRPRDASETNKFYFFGAAKNRRDHRNQTCDCAVGKAIPVSELHISGRFRRF